MKKLLILFSLVLGVIFTSNHYPAYYTGYHVVKQDTLFTCSKQYPVVVYHADTVVCCFTTYISVINILNHSNPECNNFYFMGDSIYCTNVCGINPILNYLSNYE